MPEQDEELEDFDEPGMHVTWLVKDIDAFFIKPEPTSDRDRLLHFGLTYREWLAIYFDVLDVDHGEHKKWAKSHPDEAKSSFLGGFEDEIRDYPMLSRIRNYFFDAEFEGVEVEQLRIECLKVQTITSNEKALHGLEKLILICRWAQSLDLNIFLMCV